MSLVRAAVLLSLIAAKGPALSQAIQEDTETEVPHSVVVAGRERKLFGFNTNLRINLCAGEQNASSTDSFLIDFPAFSWIAPTSISLASSLSQSINILGLGRPNSIRITSTGNDEVCLDSVILSNVPAAGKFPMWLGQSCGPPESYGGVKCYSHNTFPLEFTVNPLLSMTLCDVPDAASSGAVVMEFPENHGSARESFYPSSSFSDTVVVAGTSAISLRVTAATTDAACFSSITLEGLAVLSSPMWFQSVCASSTINGIPCVTSNIFSIPPHYYANLNLVLCSENATESMSEGVFSVTFPSNPDTPTILVTPNVSSISQQVVVVGFSPPTIVEISTDSMDEACFQSISLAGLEATGQLPHWIGASECATLPGADPCATWRNWSMPTAVLSNLFVALCQHDEAEGNGAISLTFPSNPGSPPVTINPYTFGNVKITILGSYPSSATLTAMSGDPTCLVALALDDVDMTATTVTNLNSGQWVSHNCPITECVDSISFTMASYFVTLSSFSFCQNIVDAFSVDWFLIEFPSNPGISEVRIIASNRLIPLTITGSFPTSIKVSPIGQDALCLEGISVGGAPAYGLFPTWIDNLCQGDDYQGLECWASQTWSLTSTTTTMTQTTSTMTTSTVTTSTVTTVTTSTTTSTVTTTTETTTTATTVTSSTSTTTPTTTTSSTMTYSTTSSTTSTRTTTSSTTSTMSTTSSSTSTGTTITGTTTTLTVTSVSSTSSTTTITTTSSSTSVTNTTTATTTTEADTGGPSDPNPTETPTEPPPTQAMTTTVGPTATATTATTTATTTTATTATATTATATTATPTTTTVQAVTTTSITTTTPIPAEAGSFLPSSGGDGSISKSQEEMQQDQAKAFVAFSQQQVKEALASAKASNESVVSLVSAVSKVTIFKIADLVDPSGAVKATSTQDDGSEVSVSLPSEALNGLGTDGAVVITTFIASIFEESSEQTGLGTALAVDLSSLDTGGTATVENLDNPISITLPIRYDGTQSCSFFDETTQSWSSEGVTMAPGQQVGDWLRCFTLHLSLFGALLAGFLDTLACAHLGLLSGKSIANLAVGTWYLTSAAMFYWCLVPVLLAIFLGACLTDARRRKTLAWSDEFFLIAENAGPEDIKDSDNTKAREDEPKPKEAALLGAVCGLCTACGVCCSFCRSTAVIDALDEILSNWCSNFAEVRTMCEGIIEAMDVSTLAGGTGHMFAASHKVMSNMVLSSSRRLAAAEMHLSEDVISFVLDDEDMKDLLVKVHDDHVERDGEHPRPPQQWRMSQGSQEAWVQMHHAVSQQLRKHVGRHGWRQVPRMAYALFVAGNPIGSVFLFSPFMSCGMRAFFVWIEVMGALLVLTIFYDSSGGTRQRVVDGSGASDDSACPSPPDLPFWEDLFYKLGRATAIALVSVLVAGIPIRFMQSLHTRGFRKMPYRGSPDWNKQLRVWHTQDRLIWILGTLYILFCNLFVLVFLANLDEKYIHEWWLCSFLSVVWDCLLIPMGLALIMPFIASFFMTCVSCGGRVHKTDLISDVHENMLRKSNAMLPIMHV